MKIDMDKFYLIYLNFIELQKIIVINSLNHYDNAKYDLIPKPMPNRKLNLFLNKKFGIKLI